jgi:hypothetical protein
VVWARTGLPRDALDNRRLRTRPGTRMRRCAAPCPAEGSKTERCDAGDEYQRGARGPAVGPRHLDVVWAPARRLSGVGDCSLACAHVRPDQLSWIRFVDGGATRTRCRSNESTVGCRVDSGWCASVRMIAVTDDAVPLHPSGPPRSRTSSTPIPAESEAAEWRHSWRNIEAMTVESPTQWVTHADAV